VNRVRLLRVFDVGHGLCLHVSSGRSSFVFDCGSHAKWGSDQVPLAWQRLAVACGQHPPIEVFAISHLHSDHYCGFLEPIGNVSDKLEVVLGRLPRIVNMPDLRAAFAARLLSIGPLDPGYGPLDIDLVRRIRRYAPNAIPKPVSRDERFKAANDTWQVLWPPREISLGGRVLVSITKAIEAYDSAALIYPELARRLEEVRESETYEALMDSSLEPIQFERNSVQFSDNDDNFTRQMSGHELSPKAAGGNALKTAARALRAAANHMSLIIRSGEDSMLFTGDATKFAVNAALGAESDKAFGAIITPHHGGRNYFPNSFNNAASKIWITSVGGGHLSSQVSSRYDMQPGIHHRTDQSGDFAAMLDGTNVFASVAGLNSKWASHPSIHDPLSPWWWW
jgi:hypothetical protein